MFLPGHARVKWTLHPKEMKIEFETLQSDQNYNDGSYTVIPSPDGKSGTSMTS
ncbi:MAG: hypothetical protein ACHQ9S_03235 [Candidatus Binatia bacterium]